MAVRIRRRRKTLRVLALYGVIGVFALVFKGLGYHDLPTFLEDARYFFSDPLILGLAGAGVAAFMLYSFRRRARAAVSAPPRKYRPSK